MIKQVLDNKKKYATIIYGKHKFTNEINELTQINSSLQIMTFEKKKYQEIKPHRVSIRKKTSFDNNEILIIKKGLVSIYLFNLKKKLLKIVDLKTNDMIIFYDGYHGLKFKKKSSILEIKSGPYDRKIDIPKRFDYVL